MGTAGTAAAATAAAGNPVDDFELELNSLSSTKLPISASKIQALTKAAFRAVKVRARVVVDTALIRFDQSDPSTIDPLIH